MKKIVAFALAVLFVSAVTAQNYSEIKPSQLPKPVTSYLKTTLGTYTLGKVAMTTDNGITKYAASAESKGRKSVYVFDKDGNFLERVNSFKEISPVKPSTPPSSTGKTSTSGKTVESKPDKNTPGNVKPATPATPPAGKTSPTGKKTDAKSEKVEPVKVKTTTPTTTTSPTGKTGALEEKVDPKTDPAKK